MNLLKLDASERLTAAAALHHPFFCDLLPFRHASRGQVRKASTLNAAVKVWPKLSCNHELQRLHCRLPCQADQRFIHCHQVKVTTLSGRIACQAEKAATPPASAEAASWAAGQRPDTTATNGGPAQPTANGAQKGTAASTGSQPRLADGTPHSAAVAELPGSPELVVPPSPSSPPRASNRLPSRGILPLVDTTTPGDLRLAASNAVPSNRGKRREAALPLAKSPVAARRTSAACQTVPPGEQRIPSAV